MPMREWIGLDGAPQHQRGHGGTAAHNGNFRAGALQFDLVDEPAKDGAVTAVGAGVIADEQQIHGLRPNLGEHSRRRRALAKLGVVKILEAARAIADVESVGDERDRRGRHGHRQHVVPE